MEETDHPRKVIEAVLVRAAENKIEAANARSDPLERWRRPAASAYGQPSGRGRIGGGIDRQQPLAAVPTG